jgi:hypothetical protein
VLVEVELNHCDVKLGNKLLFLEGILERMKVMRELVFNMPGEVFVELLGSA